MAGFTEEEVQGSVDRFMLRQVSVPRKGTGARDTLNLRNAVVDSLVNTLLFRVDSYFYVTWLASNKLRGLVAQQIADLDQLDTDAAGVSRPAKLIESTTDLVNAQSAVLELNAGMNARTATQGVRGSIGPAVDRFRLSVERFVSTELTKNVVVSGGVVETGEELRTKVAKTWAGILSRHDDITTRAARLSGAIDALLAVSLPQSSVQSIVGKIQDRLAELIVILNGDTGIESSRSSMLDLMTMRTLLTRASSFRNPRLVLAPLTGDPATGTLVDSSIGTEPSILGSINGPFNYDTSSITLSLNGGAATPVVALPGSSPAELRGAPITLFPYPPVPGAGAYDVNVEYDRAGSKVGTIAAAVADGPTLAASISAVTSPEVACTWDASASQLVFRSASSGDDSHLRFSSVTTDESQFVNVIFGGNLLEASASPVAAGDVVSTIQQADPGAQASAEKVILATVPGERRAAPADTIFHVEQEGSNLVTDGTEVVASPTANFEGLGVQVGWGVSVSSPFVASAKILSVAGGTLTLDVAMPGTTAAGQYLIGPDYSALPVGARVQVSGGDSRNNTGYYRVLSGGVASIVLDRDLAAEDTALSAVVFTQPVVLSVRGTTTTSGIGVLAGGAEIGFSVTPEGSASLTELVVSGIDFATKGVLAGDILDLTSPANSTYSVTVSSVSGGHVVFSPAVPYELGSWSYLLRSSRYQAFSDAQVGVQAYEAGGYAGSGISGLDTVVGQLIRGGKYGTQQQAAVADYRASLSSLQSTLDGYQIPREVAVDRMVQTLREQGFDRALDLLLALDVSSFFSMGADEVSYGTYLVRKSAIVGREVVPVSKFSKTGQVVQELRTVSFQPNPFDPEGEANPVGSESPRGGLFRQ